METFKRSIYKVGRGSSFCIPIELVREIGFKPGDKVYAYADIFNNLIYSWDKGVSIPFNKYRIVMPKGRNQTMVGLPKQWMHHHGLKNSDKILCSMGKNAVVVKPYKEEKNGGNDGES